MASQTPTIDPATGHARDLEAQVIAQAARDSAFRERVLADPKTVFAEMGLHIPPEVQVQTLQETDERFYLVLPARAELRTGTGLSDAELDNVAGGGSIGTDQPTTDSAWTGCASGQSGCVASVGCDSVALQCGQPFG